MRRVTKVAKGFPKACQLARKVAASERRRRLSSLPVIATVELYVVESSTMRLRRAGSRREENRLR